MLNCNILVVEENYTNIYIMHHASELCPHLDVAVLPGPGLPAGDVSLEGEHQLRQLRDLSPLQTWHMCDVTRESEG